MLPPGLWARQLHLDPGGQAANKIPKCRDGIGAKRAYDRHELDHIDAAFAALKVRHEGLRPAEAIAKLGLRNPRLLPRLYEQLKQLLIRLGEDGFRHMHPKKMAAGPFRYIWFSDI